MTIDKKLYYIETYGCQMNHEDSEKIAGMLIEMGYEKSDVRNDSDVIIFNTCCVRENPENKVYGNIGALKALKAKKPGLIIGVCGCMMQEEGIAQNIKKKYPQVDLIFGTHNLHRFPELLNNVMQSNSTILEVWDKEGEIVEGVPISRESDLKAYVTIMYGCNNFCTYCIVPYTRGRERSRSSKDIIDEIKNLADTGYKEIILLGQNVNSYGKDLEDMSFDKLLRLINEVDGIEYIRFMTSHPKDLNDDVILAIKECDKVCEHIHLPIQSGSTRILNKMNRKYTKEDYLILVDKIKTQIPNAAITTDFIVGFPGEEDEDFEETLDLVSKIEFDAAYSFLYSIRKGTPAAEYENQVPEDVKHARFNKLVKLVNSMSEKNNNKYLGKIVEVLVDGTRKTDESMLSGRTRTSKLVYFNGKESEYYGKLVKVKITDTHAFMLMGEIVQ